MIYDIHPLIREGLAYMINKRDWRLTASHSQLWALFSDVKTDPPDLVIFDPAEIAEHDLFTLQTLREEQPRVKWFVYSLSDSVLTRLHDQGIAVHGFVNKRCSLQALNQALTQISLQQAVVRLGPQSCSIQQQQDARVLNRLTPRELTVMHYLHQGVSNKRIAEILALSEKTISSHKRNMMAKLGARKMHEVMDFARRNNL